MSTPAAVWKHFCRFIESKRSRRFGDDLFSLVERTALFEFTDPQIDAAQQHHPRDLTEDDPHPVPPFPFPELCMVGRTSLILLRSPLMHEHTGILEFEMMLFYLMDHAETSFQMATCIVDSTTTDDEGLFPMDLRRLRGCLNDRYWDDADSLVGSPRDEEHEPDTKYLRTLAAADRRIREARDRGNHDLALKLQRHRDEVVSLRQDLTAAQGRVADQTQKIRDLGVDLEKAKTRETQSAFYLGLQAVNWINHPDHYTVETQGPPAQRKQHKRLQRLGERPRYIVLTKNEITEEWHRVNRGGTHASPIPHLRRGHYKTLRSARYKEKQGQRIWVRASHVGGACVEWRDGDTRYKVT